MVRNIHERRLAASPIDLGALLDSLASTDDLLWPAESWPAMRFDGPLAVGARGGHGPIRYSIESYEPGRSIRFRFEAPHGFDGYHEFEIIPAGTGTILRHALVMRCHGAARISWPLLYRPLHDALVEDGLAKAQQRLGPHSMTPRTWNWRVRLLRSLASRTSPTTSLKT